MGPKGTPTPTHWVPEGNMAGFLQFWPVWGRCSAKFGPRSLPNGPGLKNDT